MPTGFWTKWGEDDEDLRNSALLSSLGLGSNANQPSARAQMYGSIGQTNPQHERSFLDRLFAPFEAPQQTLFALSTGRGLWESMSHGARYFNPWSNEERISPEEVRQAFFGDMADGWAKGTANLAISLLFDPLFLAPIAKAAGVGGKALRTVGHISNPASAVADATLYAAREVVGPLSKTAYARVFGEEALLKAQGLGTQVINGALNRFHGVPDAVRTMVRKFESTRANLYGEGVRVIKGINRMSPEARPILTTALEDSSVYAARFGEKGSASTAQLRRVQEIEEKVLKSGTSPDLFWQNYDRARALDDEVGKLLVDYGLLSSERHAELAGTHLRRIYQAHENPANFVEKLDSLITSYAGATDEVVPHFQALRRNLSEMSEEIYKTQGPLGVQSGLFDSAQAGAATSRYFDKTGRLHAKNLSEDIVDYLNKNSASSIDEVFTHVKDSMLGGANLPGEFYKSLADYMSGGLFMKEGTATWFQKLKDRSTRVITGTNAPTFSWRTFKENMEVINQRKDIPEIVREAMGEITDAAPRLAAQVRDVGGLVAARKLFDDIAGVRRLSANDLELLQQARTVGYKTPEARKAIEEVAQRAGVTVDELAADMNRLLDEGLGAQIGGKGSAWASPEKAANNPSHIYQMPVDETYGAMSGMWTDAGTHAMLRASDARDTIRSNEGRLLESLGNMYRDGIGMFKMFKAVVDPTGQTRNFFGGAVLASMSGLGFDVFRTMPKAKVELSHWIHSGTLGKYMKLADDAGVSLWKQDLMSVEIREIANRYLTTEAADVASKTDWTRPFSAVFHAVDEFFSKTPGVQNITRRITGDIGATIGDAVAHNFQYGDQLWKMNVFIDQYDKLAGAWAKQGKALTEAVRHDFAQQAAGLAQQALFNYADVPWLIDFTRKWGIVPFATFPFKAVPFVAKTLYDAPWRVLRYDRLVDGVNSMLTDSPEELAMQIDNLPEYMRDKMIIKLPWDDDRNNPQFLDMSYFVPWEAVQSIAETGEFRSGFRSGFARPPAVNLIDILINSKDAMGRDIIVQDSGRTNLQNFEALANALASFALPSWAPAGARASSWGRSMMAHATNSPTPVKWREQLGLAARSPIGFISEALGGESVTRENMTNARGLPPAQHAQTARGGAVGNLALPFTSLLGGSVASQPGTALAERKAKRSNLLREEGRIRAARGLSLTEKRRRIAKLREEARQ